MLTSMEFWDRPYACVDLVCTADAQASNQVAPEQILGASPARQHFRQLTGHSGQVGCRWKGPHDDALGAVIDA